MHPFLKSEQKKWLIDTLKEHYQAINCVSYLCNSSFKPKNSLVLVCLFLTISTTKKMKYGKENEDRNVKKLIRYNDLGVINTSEAQPVFKPISIHMC